MAALEDMAEAVAAGRFAWIDRGTHTIDFVHVENLVGAVVRALTQGRHQGIYYVTDGTPMSVRDFLTPCWRPAARTSPRSAASRWPWPLRWRR